jgi:hypothetical protein
MNNCVGAGNLKHFVLFLIYTWTSSAYALALFGWNYFFCADEDCTFHPVVIHLVRVMTLLAIGAFLFTSSMLMNVCYGVMTGIGTIDRLKKKATNTMTQSDEEPINLIDVSLLVVHYYVGCKGICFSCLSLTKKHISRAHPMFFFVLPTGFWHCTLVHVAVSSRSHF